MAVEPEEFIGAERHPRTTQRRAYRNGIQPKRVDLPVGTVTVPVPKTAGNAPGDAFYPKCGGTASRPGAWRVAASELRFGSLSSAPISRAVKERDAKLEE